MGKGILSLSLWLLFLPLCLTSMTRELIPDWNALTHPCDRPCRVNEPPKTCEYNFTVEWYIAMSKACYNCPFVEADCDRPHCIAADGLRRLLISANRMMPGPTLKVCHNDRVVVHVHNELDDGQGTTLHWHGIHQKGTPYMDGTHMVTQCPIPTKGKFKYDFKADPSGTHFWHSHTGFQKSEGLQGGFIVRSPPEDDPHYDLYDHDCETPSGDCEHIIMLADWLDESSLARFLLKNFNAGGRSTPVSGLINGKSKRYDVIDYRDENRTGKTPREVFKVIPGKKYRFRVINAANLVCPFKVAVPGHKLTIIAADGHPVEATEVDKFYATPGERYDFIITFDQPVRNYWLQVLGANKCEPANVFGIIRYQGAPEAEPTSDQMFDPAGTLLNPPPWDPTPTSPADNKEILIYELSSTQGTDVSQDKVDVQIIAALDIIANDNIRFNHKEFYSMTDVPKEKNLEYPNLNNITFMLPPVPILSQPDDFNSSWLCNRDTVDMDLCFTEGCTCTNHVKVGLGELVELIMVNEGTTNKKGHPMHLHGYNFQVVGSGKLGDSIRAPEVVDMWNKRELPRNFASPSQRDSVWVPDGGYVIGRFRADNPGYWLFHCHIESHVESGQTLLIQVGERGDLPPVPKGFPRCGYWPEMVKEQEQEQESTCTKSCSDVESGAPRSTTVLGIIFILLSSYVSVNLSA